MGKRRVIVDIDGVLSNFNDAFARLLAEKGAQLRPFEDPRGPDCWDWPTVYGASKGLTDEAWKWVEEHPEWWGGLEPLVEFNWSAHGWLDELLLSEEVTFVTSRPGRGVRDVTRDWLAKHVVSWPNKAHVVVTPADKVHCLMAMQPDVVIEDRIKTLQDYATVCKHPCVSLLVDRPYNNMEETDSFGITRVENTSKALEKAMGGSCVKK